MTRATDRLADALLVLFAAWTLIYHVGLLLAPPTWGLLLAWLVVAAVLGALYASGRLEDRPLWPGSPEEGTDRPDRPGPRLAVSRRTVAVVAVAGGIAAGTAAGLHESGVPWWCAWAPGVVSVGASAFALLRGGGPGRPDGTGEDPGAGGRPDGDRRGPAATAPDAPGSGSPEPERPEGRWGTPLALLTGAGFAVASLFIVNSDGDDAYFVSRSVATAGTGRIPFDDVIFTDGTTDPIAGEPPVASFEVLAGALARVLGMQASSFLWYVLLPAVTFLAVWSLWRLIRTWAPRRALACFGVAAVYLLWSGTSGASLGSFHLLRMWQGKAVMVSALIPLLYVYLTRFAERRTRSGLLLLAAAGVAATGLTSTAAIVIPLVTGGAVAALLVSGRIRTGLAASVAMAYPLAAGVVVVLFHGETSVLGDEPDAPFSYAWVLLQGVLGVLSGCALWLAPWTVGRRVPALIVTGAAAMLTVAILPGVIPLAGDLSGTGQVLWRTMWVVPAPALVGLLAAVSVPRAWLRRAGRAAVVVPFAPAAALAVAIVVGGVPLWSAQSGSLVADRPAWKYPPLKIGTARSVIRAAGPGGTVLMPQGHMRAVPLLSADVHAINPNTHYLTLVPAPPRFRADRELLTEVARSPGGLAPGTGPGIPAIRDALRRTGVTVACTHPADGGGQRLLEQAGFRGRKRIGELVCLFPRKD